MVVDVVLKKDGKRARAISTESTDDMVGMVELGRGLGLQCWLSVVMNVR